MKIFACLSIITPTIIFLIASTTIELINGKEKSDITESIWNCSGYCCVVIHPYHDLVKCENTTLANVTILENADDVLYDNIKPAKFPLLEDTSFSDHYKENVRYFSWKRSNISIVIHIPLRDIVYLDLSYNRIQTIDLNAFNISEKLKDINLSHNQITSLPSDLFSKNPLIITINLSFNNIHIIPDRLLKPLSKLYTLDLSHNLIEIIFTDSMNENRDLREIFLNSNLIKTIEDDVFLDKKLLTKIDLQSNLISKIPKLLFYELIELKWLNLGNNRIYDLDSEINTNDLKNLEFLNLSANPFISISTEFVENLLKLKKLIITNTSLTEFQKGLLQNLNQLDTLILSANENLTNIIYDTFEDKHALRNIDISFNRLSTIPISISTLSPYRLNITGNPLSCNCNLQWYVIWRDQKLKENPSNKIDGLKCMIDYDGKNESYIREMLLNMPCPPVMAYITPREYYDLDKSAMLECRVYGIPIPSISWSTPSGIVFHRIDQNSDDRTYASHPAVHDANMAPVKSNRVRAIGQYTFSLLTSDLQREDGGKYTCFARNKLQMSKSETYVYIKTDTMAKIKINSFIAGFSWASIFFAATLFVQFMIYLYVKCGQCRNIPKSDNGLAEFCGMEETLQVKPQVETLNEIYKQQLERVRENCAQQMERIRESYLNQMQNLSDLRDYSSNQLGTLRDSYYEQVQRVRDYSLSQLTKVRDNYVVQRKRLCKFGANQMDKIIEECKQQQQNINKLLENLPDNCAQRSNCVIGITDEEEDEEDYYEHGHDVDELDQYNKTIQSQIEELTSPSKLLLPEIHEMLLIRGSGSEGGGGGGGDGDVNQQEPTETSPLTIDVHHHHPHQGENMEHAV